MSLKADRAQAGEYVRQMRIARGGQKLRATRKAVLKVAEALATENAVKRRGHVGAAKLGVAL